MCWVQPLEEDHFVLASKSKGDYHEFALLEALVDEQIILLMNCAVAAGAHALEHLEASSQPARVRRLAYVAEL